MEPFNQLEPINRNEDPSIMNNILCPSYRKVMQDNNWFIDLQSTHMAVVKGRGQGFPPGNMKVNPPATFIRK